MRRRLAAILSLDAAGFSASMAADADATMAALRRVLRDAVRPAVRAGRGRIVKLMGDGALVEFPSAGAAIEAAAAILGALRDDPVRVRAGVHVGDVVEHEGDLFGDAVNLAARLQAAAEPGAALVSRAAADMAGGGGAGAALRPEGVRRFRGIPRPVEVLSLTPVEAGPAPEAFRARQNIRFATASDGVRLAWTAIGEGPPLVKAPNWIQHLELDWELLWQPHVLSALARRRRLVRFDARGNGLSDRDPPAMTLDRFAEDLRTVFDAAGIARAPVFGISQGGPIAIRFAVEHPERVSALIMIGSFAQGFSRREKGHSADMAHAIQAMIRAGWDDPYPSMRDHLAAMIAPDAAQEDLRRSAELMREIITPEAMFRTREAVDDFDVTELLPQVRCPTLVLHARDERLHPAEQGRMLAAGIPGARFVALPSRNHCLPEYDPAWPLAEREIAAFLDGLDDART